MTRRVAAGLAIWMTWALGRQASAQGMGSLLVPRLERTAQSRALGPGAVGPRGVNALGANPAGLGTGRYELLAQHQPLLGGASADMLGAAAPIARLGAAVGADIVSVRSGGLDRRDGAGASRGGFDAEERLFGFYFSRTLGGGEASAGPGEGPLELGAGFKLAQLRVDSRRAGGLAWDLGAIYRPSGGPLSFGFAATNLSAGALRGEGASQWPTAFALSAGWQAAGGLNLLAGAAQHAQERRGELSAGAEYRLAEFFSLRGRYAASPGAAAGGIGDIAFGFGVGLFGPSTIDYSFEPLEPALRSAGSAGLHRLTLTLRWEPGPQAAEPPAREPAYYRGTFSLAPEAEPEEKARPEPRVRYRQIGGDARGVEQGRGGYLVW